MKADKYKIKLIYKQLHDAGLDMDTVTEVVLTKAIPAEELTNTDANLIIRYLYKYTADRKVPMQRKLIHMLCLYGMTDSKGDPDMDRIQRYIAQIGSRNPKGKNLYHLSYAELLAVTNQVTAMTKKEVYHKRC
ncbi:MAG TPA: hypothetical protein PK047_06980 [Saprospiraceae bacterium]|jgi:hypothetical protein|nr:hypothetical protein [Saprospiraceae bacterium]HRP41981.1 hypothetical protein [Saprospiraceae bacterium]